MYVLGPIKMDETKRSDLNEGKWLPTGDKKYVECSKCETYWERDLVDNLNMGYCPSCGSHNKKQYLITVGDEVASIDDDIKATVLDETDDTEMWLVLTENACVERWHSDDIKKTGRHFSQIHDLIDLMRKDDE